MNKLILIVSVLVCLIFIQPNLSAKAKEKNPFASHITKIERNEKKVSKMDKKKDKKKIKSYQERILKDKAKFASIVDKKKEEVQKKIEKLEEKLQKEEAAGKDVTIIKKQIHGFNNELIKINAWAKNEDPPELEKFQMPNTAKKDNSGAATAEATTNGGTADNDDGGFDAEAFRKQMETPDKKTEPPPAKKKKAKGPKKKGWSWYGDSDKDGKVSEEEWLKKRKQTAKKDKVPYVEFDQKDIFRTLDKDGDGAISKDEMPK